MSRQDIGGKQLVDAGQHVGSRVTNGTHAIDRRLRAEQTGARRQTKLLAAHLQAAPVVNIEIDQAESRQFAFERNTASLDALCFAGQAEYGERPERIAARKQELQGRQFTLDALSGGSKKRRCASRRFTRTRNIERDAEDQRRLAERPRQHRLAVVAGLQASFRA